MQVFISWSGPQSNAVAVALRDWLPKVLAQRVAAFVSSEDIDKGSRGLARIATELEASDFGVIVVTPTNVESTWINFEAGALGKAVTDSRLAPLLVGIADADLDGPLKQFQNAAASDRAAVLALVLSINKAQAEPVDLGTVDTLFNAHWQELDGAIVTALGMDVAEPEPKRDPGDILDEVLVTVRSLQREVAALRAESQLLAAATTAQEADNFAKFLALQNRAAGVSIYDRAAAGSNANLLTAMLRSVRADFTLSLDSTIGDIELKDGAPELPPDVLRDIRGLAANQKLVITITRSNGSGIRYTPDGIERRRLAGERTYDSVDIPAETGF